MTSTAAPHESPETDPLSAASARLLDTVQALSADAWGEPSLLPGWSRGHLVAHLTLNAEAIAAAIVGVLEDRPVTMYASDEARDADIAELATSPHSTVVRRFVQATGRLDEALAALAAAPGQLAERVVERTPGSSRRFPIAAVGETRLREVEIHHVDLDLGYSPAQWSQPFVHDLLTQGVHRPLGFDARLEATDLSWSHQIGNGGPTIAGPGHGLAWWLTGRPPYPGAEPTSDAGELPTVEAL